MILAIIWGLNTALSVVVALIGFSDRNHVIGLAGMLAAIPCSVLTGAYAGWWTIPIGG